jgi:hypothetical protein
LYPESTDLKSGGDAEAKPQRITGKLKNDNQSKVGLKAPLNEGRFRLFVSVTDGQKVAYMNVPFYVQNDINQQQNIGFKKQTLSSFDEE